MAMGSFVVEFVSSFNSQTQNPPARRKDLGDISYTKLSYSLFCLKFHCMATGSGNCLNHSIVRLPRWVQRFQRYLLYKSSY